MHSLEKILWIFITLGHVVILATLIRTNLNSVYRWFTTLIAQDLVQTFFLWQIRGLHVYRYYLWAYVIGAGLDLFFQLFSVRELFSSRSWKGKAISVSLALYMGLEAFTLLLVISHGPRSWRIALQHVQPLYLLCEIGWILLLWSISSDAKRQMKGDNQ